VTPVITKLAKEVRLFGFWLFTTCIGYAIAYLGRAVAAIITVPVLADLLGMTKEAVVGLVLTWLPNWLPNWLLLAGSALMNAAFWHEARRERPSLARTPRPDLH
jgi:hypothetical protein